MIVPHKPIFSFSNTTLKITAQPHNQTRSTLSEAVYHDDGPVAMRKEYFGYNSETVDPFFYKALQL